ncbi:MAG: hypothetical protein CFE45_05220, partial [Burkholderiales bacterium PBB5]
MSAGAPIHRPDPANGPGHLGGTSAGPAACGWWPLLLCAGCAAGLPLVGVAIAGPVLGLPVLGALALAGLALGLPAAHRLQRHLAAVGSPPAAAMPQTLAHLQAIANASDDVILAKDLQRRFVFINPAAAASLGCQPSEVLGQLDEGWLSAESQALVARHDAQVLASRQLMTFEETLQSPGGEFLVSSTRGPLLGADGTVVGVFCIARDVTAQRRAEQALHESQAWLGLAMADGGQTIWQLDLRQPRVLFSTEAARQLGLTPNMPDGLALTPEAAQALVHPDDRSRVRAALSRTKREGVPYREQYRVTRVDGRQLWLSDRGCLIRDDTGQPLRLLATVHDVTAQRLAEQQRADAATRWHFLFQQSQDAVYLLDLQGRLIEANPAFAALLGRPVDAVAGLHIGDWDLDLPSDCAQREALRDSHSIDSRISRWQLAGGRVGEVETRVQRVQHGDEPVLLCSSHDVSAQRAVAQRLRSSEQRLALALAATGMGVWEW